MTVATLGPQLKLIPVILFTGPVAAFTGCGGSSQLTVDVALHTFHGPMQANQRKMSAVVTVHGTSRARSILSLGFYQRCPMNWIRGAQAKKEPSAECQI